MKVQHPTLSGCQAIRCVGMPISMAAIVTWTVKGHYCHCMTWCVCPVMPFTCGARRHLQIWSLPRTTAWCMLHSLNC